MTNQPRNLSSNSSPETECAQDKLACFGLPHELAHKDCPDGIQVGDTKHPNMLLGSYWGCKYNPTKDAAKRFDMQTLVEKDMVALWRRSWVVLRLPNVNPGFWAFHCHMEQHIPMGQMMAIALQKSRIGPIPKDVPREGNCPVVGPTPPPAA